MLSLFTAFPTLLCKVWFSQAEYCKNGHSHICHLNTQNHAENVEMQAQNHAENVEMQAQNQHKCATHSLHKCTNAMFLYT